MRWRRTRRAWRRACSRRSPRRTARRSRSRSAARVSSSSRAPWTSCASARASTRGSSAAASCAWPPTRAPPRRCARALPSSRTAGSSGGTARRRAGTSRVSRRSVAGALWSPREGHVDAERLTRAYARAAQSLGARFECGAPAVALGATRRTGRRGADAARHVVGGLGRARERTLGGRDLAGRARAADPRRCAASSWSSRGVALRSIVWDERDLPGAAARRPRARRRDLRGEPASTAA